MSAPNGDASTSLAGVRVADFSRVLAGPYASMLLADLGADVIKVEPPSGDGTRHWVPPVDRSGRGTYFNSVNRNKRSIICDFTSADGLDEAQRIARTADVFIENFRPGVTNQFGLDYDKLRQYNPAVIYCSITGFGEDASQGLPGYDLLVQAVGGLMSITGEPEGDPSKVGVALVDVLCGLHAAVGIQAALAARNAGGPGQRVEVNLMSTLLSSLVNQASSTLATGESPVRLGNAHPSIAPYELFSAADRHLVVAVGNDRQFKRLVDVLELPQVADDRRFVTNAARVAHRSELNALLTERLRTASAEHWVEVLTAASVPAGLVNTVAEALSMADSLGLDSTVDVSGPGRRSPQIASPIKLSGTPVQYLRPPPDLGEHQGATWLTERREQ